MHLAGDGCPIALQAPPAAVKRRLRAVQQFIPAAQGGLDAIDGLLLSEQEVRHLIAKAPGAIIESSLALDEHLLHLVLVDLPLVGDLLAVIRDTIPLIRGSVSLVRDPVPLLGDHLAGLQRGGKAGSRPITGL